LISRPSIRTIQKPQQQPILTLTKQYQFDLTVSKKEITHIIILNMRQISILLILTVLLSFKIDNGNKIDESSIPSVKSLLNKKVPHFTGYLINESVVDETFLDKKVILLNFMFIGCQGCMQELPNLDKLHEKYRNTNFMIVTIMRNGIEDIKSYQGIGDTSKVFYQIRKMLKSERIPNPIIAECKSVKQTGPVNSIKTCTDNISKEFFISKYPTNLLVDKSGIITKIYSNLVDDAEYLDLQVQIDSLLK
jgi:thiol-disulfide isomerase/thioredoxin